MHQYPETASRLRGRIEAVIDFAKARGCRSGENPAAWRGHLALILAYRDLPEFIGKLREHRSVSTTAMALEFAILTAARSGEVLGACWSEFDLDAKVWTIPANRMKAGREHRVPLSSQAMTIVETLATTLSSEFIFPGRSYKSPLSPAAIKAVLVRLKIEGATVHPIIFP